MILLLNLFLMHFIDFCQKISPLPEATQAQLEAMLHHSMLPKGSSILPQGGYCNDLFFLDKGLVKLGFYNDGKEFIMRFFEENILFTELESLLNRQASKYEITALEDCSLTRIPYYQFEQLCAQHHKLETFFRKFLSIAHLNMMQRISEILEEDARARYLNFLENAPNLMQRISLGDLANYLGITQVSLSRIRANL